MSTAPPAAPSAQLEPAARPRALGVPVLLAGVLVLVVVLVLSIGLGARDISPVRIVEILFAAGEGYDADVLWVERIPRTILGLLVGAALGAAGLLMQGITRNPLADPGVLGIESGAAFFVVAAIVVFDVHSLTGYFWFALLGAAVTASLVYVLGTRTASRNSTVGLVLAGAAAGALMSSLITLLVVRDEAVFASLRFWSVGQLTGRAKILDEAAPFLIVGLILALPLGRTLNILGLGEDTAAGLGMRVGRAQLAVSAVAVLLCAAATAAIGPIAFVGLVAGHIARMLIGSDHRWSLPLSMIVGAVVLLAADILARILLGPGELQVGVMTALVGTPFFVWLARRRTLVTL